VTLEGNFIDVEWMVRTSLAVVGFILSLGLVVNPLVSDVSAAQQGFLAKRMGRALMPKMIDLRESAAPSCPDPLLYRVVNEQIVQSVEPQRQEPPVSEAQEQASDNSTPVSPVGIAPESKKEILPSWMVRTFDLPGAGVLTPKGTLIVEPSLQFAHLSSNRVTLTGFTIVPAITVGLINIQGVSRDIYTASLVGRYGITNRLEVEVRVPYLYREDSITQRPVATPSQADTLSTFNGSGLGDVEATGRYQINQGGPDKPYFIGFARFKSTSGTGPFEVPQDPVSGVQTELPTGSGFYIFQPGLTVLFPSDPVVVFGGASFIYNIPRDVGNGIGRVDPGSGGNANIGLGLSLNEKLSLTLGYDHTIFSKPTSASNLLLTTAPQATHIGVLLIGGSYRWSDRSFVNFVVGVGATREAPDLQVTLRIPMAFPLWK